MENEILFKNLGIREEILENIKLIGWKKPTPIQEKIIKKAISGEDVTGMAETGSGKTGAFLIPLIQRLIDLEKPEKFGLILAPSRELVLQIQEISEKLSKNLNIIINSVYGGVDDVSQMAQLAKRPHIIISTPGRMTQLIKEAIGFDLKPIQVVIIDEADKMGSVDFFNDLSIILSQISKKHQTMLFSATMPKNLTQFTSLFSNSSEIVKLTNEINIPIVLKEFLVVIPKEKKDCLLFNLLNEYKDNQILIFIETCRDATILSDFLKRLGFKVGSAHGSMTQNDRIQEFSNFKDGLIQILVSTNVVGRGVDFPNIDVVIHYDLPSNGKEYIHRSGRAGRANRIGYAITIITQDSKQKFLELENFLQRKIEKKNINKEEIEKNLNKILLLKQESIDYYKKLSRIKK